MKSLVFALAVASMVAAAAPAANAADGCGFDRHFSPFYGHCVWNRFDNDGPRFRFWWGNPFWFHHRFHDWR